MYDLLLGADGKEFLLHPLLNYGRGGYDGLYDMMSDPMTVQGLGDGGAHSAIVCDASMTTYLLTHWARDRTRGPRLAARGRGRAPHLATRPSSTASTTAAGSSRAGAPT